MYKYAAINSKYSKWMYSYVVIVTMTVVDHVQKLAIAKVSLC